MDLDRQILYNIQRTRLLRRFGVAWLRLLVAVSANLNSISFDRRNSFRNALRSTSFITGISSLREVYSKFTLLLLAEMDTNVYAMGGVSNADPCVVVGCHRASSALTQWL